MDLHQRRAFAITAFLVTFPLFDDCFYTQHFVVLYGRSQHNGFRSSLMISTACTADHTTRRGYTNGKNIGLSSRRVLRHGSGDVATKSRRYICIIDMKIQYLLMKRKLKCYPFKSIELSFWLDFMRKSRQRMAC